MNDDNSTIRIRSTRRRTGYVLVMCLFLITIAGLLLMQMARYGLHQSLTALDATSRFQAHWSRMSARQALLDRAEHLFVVHESSLGTSTPEIRWDVKLNNTMLRLSLMDEDAKANINTLVELLGPEKAQQSLVNAAPHLSNWISFRPLKTDDRDRNKFDGWGQVYAFDGEGGGSHRRLPLLEFDEIRRTFTLWGTGRLNISRASEQAIANISDLVLDRSSTLGLVRLRNQSPDSQSTELIAQLGLRGEPLRVLRRSIGDRSRSYSLSIRNLDDPEDRVWNCDYVLPGYDLEEMHGYYYFDW